MTQKENLLLKALEIENEIAKLNGNEEKVIDTNSNAFYNEARQNKAYELQERIEKAEHRLAEARKEKAEKEWLETEEGKAYKERMEEARANLRNGRAASEKKAVSELNALIQSQLGSQWGLCAFSDHGLGIGIIDTEKAVKDDGTFREVFGHEFTVYLESDWEGERFDINYGTLGGFNPTRELSRVDFLVGLAKFASDTNLQEEVKRIHKEYLDTVHTLCKAYKAVKAENPYEA